MDKESIDTTYKSCNNCTLSEYCDHYEGDKTYCDYNLSKRPDQDKLDYLMAEAENLISTQINHMKKFQLLMKKYGDDPSIFEASTRCSKRIMSMIRDFNSIKEKMDQPTQNKIWENILGKV